MDTSRRVGRASLRCELFFLGENSKIVLMMKAQFRTVSELASVLPFVERTDVLRPQGDRAGKCSKQPILVLREGEWFNNLSYLAPSYRGKRVQSPSEGS